MKKFLNKVFGGLNLNWPRTIIFAIIMGIYTALVAMLVPEGNSFHDIAVTLEWWVLPAIFIVANCKTPLDAALKTFVFFLISQPLVYLIQVPFSQMGWELFNYYPYWFGFTLATFPAAFICWFIKKDQWYSALILAGVNACLAFWGINYLYNLSENFPNHLFTAIYCLISIIVYSLVLLKSKLPRLICASISLVVIITLAFIIKGEKPYEAYRNTLIEENNITLVGEPYISYWTSERGRGDVTIRKTEDGTYVFKITGTGRSKYKFSISDDQNSYDFEYYFDKDKNTVIVNRL